MNKYHRIALVGDSLGISQLLEFVPNTSVACFIAASIRPQYLQQIAHLAEQRGKPLLIQPKPQDESYKNFISEIKSLDIDLLLCNSYSMILRKDLLQLVNYNAINLHAALLPRNRGPNPAQWAIIKGEAETGVTLHYINDELDAGNIIAQRKILIAEQDTWVSLLDKLTKEAYQLMKTAMPEILAGENQSISQNHSIATRNIRLAPDSPKIDFLTMSDREIYNLIRAQVHPLSGAYFFQDGKKFVLDKFIPFEEISNLREKYFPSLPVRMAETAMPQGLIALKCESIFKSFPVYDEGKSWRILFRSHKGEKNILALNNISLVVPKGKFVGILGHNGAGKSTLLRTLSGTYAPDSGKIETQGSLSGLFELGGIGNRYITGYEYAKRMLQLQGIKSKVINRYIEDIYEFSELQEKFHQALYTYSTGMSARLYFAVATALNYDIYLIDEVLSVGDEHFRNKCWHRLQEKFSQGASGVLVTHDWSAVIKLCEEAHIISQGQIIKSGRADSIVQNYLNLPVANQKNAYFSENNPLTYKVISKKDAEISFDIISIDDQVVECNYSIEWLRLGVGWEIILLSPHWFTITKKAGKHTVCLKIPQLPLAPGKYFLNLFLRTCDEGVSVVCDERTWTQGNALELVVEGHSGATVMTLPSKWEERSIIQ